MHNEFSSVWKAAKRPYWLTPWGTVVPLVVDNLIPYLVVGSIVEPNAPGTEGGTWTTTRKTKRENKTEADKMIRESK